MDNRALSTVVEKLLGLGLTVLFIGLLTTTLFAGSIPAYQAAVGTELGERTLAEATARIEQAVPPETRAATATMRVELPPTLDGATYEIRTDGRELVLGHPDPDIGDRTRPVFPDHVGALTGSWQSGTPLVVSAAGPRGNLTVTLENR